MNKAYLLTDLDPLTNLVFRSPVAVLGRNFDRTEPVYGNAEHRVDGAQADGVVDG